MLSTATQQVCIITSIIDRNDTPVNFCNFFYRLEELSWDKKLVNNMTVDETGEIVKILKVKGSYEKIIKSYVPLPCEKRIEPDILNTTNNKRMYLLRIVIPISLSQLKTKSPINKYVLNGFRPYEIIR